MVSTLLDVLERTFNIKKDNWQFSIKLTEVSEKVASNDRIRVKIKVEKVLRKYMKSVFRNGKLKWNENDQYHDDDTV